MLKRCIAFISLISFLTYTLIGCSGKESIYSSPVSEIKFTNNQRYPVKKEKLYSECLLLLQERGYIIKLSDFETGLLSAEFSGGGLIGEDVKGSSEEDNTCLNIISIILFVGFIFLIISSFNSNYESSECDEYYYEDEYYDSYGPVAASYQYNITLTIASVNKDTTECRLILIRSDAENGIIVSQRAVMNKYFNHSFFDELSKRLSF